MADPFALARDVLRIEGAKRRTRASDIRQVRAIILREFGLDGLERLEAGVRAQTIEACALSLEGDADELFAAANALKPEKVPNASP